MCTFTGIVFLSQIKLECFLGLGKRAENLPLEKVTVSESGRLQTGECEWIVEQQNGNLPHVAMVGKRQENAAKNLLSDVCLVFTVCVPTMGIGRCTIDKQVEREQI